MESSRPGRTAPLDALRREAQRSLFRARNGIKVLAGPGPEVGLTPNQVVWRRGKARLLRYASDKKTRRTPLLIVFSIISRAYIMDLRSGHSDPERLQGFSEPPALALVSRCRHSASVRP